MPDLSRYRPQVLALLRIMAALLFLEHGLMKLFAFPVAQAGVPSPLPPLLIAAAVIETVGGTLLALGLFTRVAAFICSGQMAFAYFIGHAPNGPWPGANGGDAAILFCFIFLYIFVAGPGAWSVDGSRKR